MRALPFLRANPACAWLALLWCALAPAVVAAPEPADVVRTYVDAFKRGEREVFMACLSEAFFELYKAEYTRLVDHSSGEKQAALLKPLNLEHPEQLKAMNGRQMFSTILGKPVADAYWKVFETVEIVVEVETLERNDTEAVVKSHLSTKGSSPAKVETIFWLTHTDAGWKIDRFQKRRIDANAVPQAEPSKPAAPRP